MWKRKAEVLRKVIRMERTGARWGTSALRIKDASEGTFIILSRLKWRHTALTMDVLCCVAQKCVDVLLLFIKASWFPHRLAEREQPLYQHPLFSSSSVVFFYLFGMFWVLQTDASHVVAPVTFWTLSWLKFGAVLLNLLSSFSSSGPSWVPSSSQERPLKGMFTHRCCVHSHRCISFQRILFPSMHRGVWPAGAVTRPLCSKVQTSLGWAAGSGTLSSSFNS